MVGRIDPPELKLNKANASDTDALCFDLHLSVSNGFVLSAITLILTYYLLLFGYIDLLDYPWF